MVSLLVIWVPHHTFHRSHLSSLILYIQTLAKPHDDQEQKHSWSLIHCPQPNVWDIELNSDSVWYVEDAYRVISLG